MLRLLSFSCLLATAAAKGAFEATDAKWNNDVINSGKNCFVKFLAPW